MPETEFVEEEQFPTPWESMIGGFVEEPPKEPEYYEIVRFQRFTYKRYSRCK